MPLKRSDEDGTAGRKGAIVRPHTREKTARSHLLKTLAAAQRASGEWVQKSGMCPGDAIQAGPGTGKDTGLDRWQTRRHPGVRKE